MSHNKLLIENQIKEVKTWVLTKVLKKREYNWTETELQSKDILKDWYRESERRMKEKDSWMEDIQKLRTNADSEEKAEELELRRMTWWMRTERNEDKKQLKLYQDSHEVWMRKIEDLRREVDEKL
ncbi:hypothetical protein MHYP_G00162890 [Metynnis hypsauchen]